MKKVLVLLSMISMAQGLNSEQQPASLQPTQYKYLNRLHEDSQIRKQCELVDRAWFVKGEAENACDALDDLFDAWKLHARAHCISFKTGNSCNTQAPSSKEFNNAVTTLVGVFNKDNEFKHVKKLTEDISFVEWLFTSH